MSMYKKIAEIPTGFDKPTALPQTPEQAKEWQERNRTWWERHPMRYDWGNKIPAAEFSKEFYEEIDRRFFESAEHYLPSTTHPFDQLIPYERLPNMDVLEIGVGNGSHAALLAANAKSFTGIDLTQYAVNSTTKRLEAFGLPGKVMQMDAENMTFLDASFDFIWTWGVIHHSSNTHAILKQMARVLRPGGKAVVMVYHRNLWEYYVRLGVLRVLRNGWNRGQIHKTAQLGTDGGLARFYRIDEWEQLVGEFFDVDFTRIVGQKAGVLPLPGKLGLFAQRVVPDRFTRLLSNDLKMGQFLVCQMTKKR